MVQMTTKVWPQSLFSEARKQTVPGEGGGGGVSRSNST